MRSILILLFLFFVVSCSNKDVPEGVEADSSNITEEDIALQEKIKEEQLALEQKKAEEAAAEEAKAAKEKASNKTLRMKIRNSQKEKEELLAQEALKAKEALEKKNPEEQAETTQTEGGEAVATQEVSTNETTGLLASILSVFSKGTSDDDISAAEEEARLREEAERNSVQTEDDLIDLFTEFKANMVIDYYGLPILILRLPKVEVKIEEDFNKDRKVKKESENPDDYLSYKIDFKTPSDKVPTLTDTHKALIKELLSKMTPGNKYVVIMYVNGTNLKSWGKAKKTIEKTVYSQYVSTFVYLNTQNVRLEKRYITNIPEDEIFLTVAKYNGDVGSNVYTADKGSVIKWLETYKILEINRAEESKRRKKELDNILSNSGKTDTKKVTVKTKNESKVTDKTNVESKKTANTKSTPAK